MSPVTQERYAWLTSQRFPCSLQVCAPASTLWTLRDSQTTAPPEMPEVVIDWHLFVTFKTCFLLGLDYRLLSNLLCSQG